MKTSDISNRLREKIRVSKEFNDPGDAADWGNEKGILISRNDAQYFLSLADSLDKIILTDGEIEIASDWLVGSEKISHKEGMKYYRSHIEKLLNPIEYYNPPYVEGKTDLQNEG